MKKIITYGALGVVSIIQTYPLIWMLFMSLKNNNEIFGGNTMGFPQTLRWENYSNAMHTGNIFVYFLNSTIVTIIAIAISTFLATTVAYAIARMRWKLGRPTLNFFLLGVMIPAQAIILPIYITMHKMGLYDTRISLIIVYIVFALPVAIYIFTGFMRGLPGEIEESSTIDGASIYRIFISIIIPMTRPAIATVIIFSFLAIWNEFMYAFILVDDLKLRTLTVGLLSMRGMYNTDWGAMGAGLVIATFPTVIIYLLLNGNVQKSLIEGAVKG